METIPVKMNATRVCDAIARIGYQPWSAIMDIIDNSITADATEVTIHFDLEENTTLSQKGNVLGYKIIDNGKGMNDDEICNALKLGSDANYPENSLSKYGMGLKSAGFSLGRTIKVFSKKNSESSSLNFIDRDVIGSDYIICRLPLEESDVSEELLESYPSGTAIIISKANHQKQYSANTIIEKLKEKLGVTYFEFLKRENNPLNIILKYRDKEEKIQPYDMLFLDDALETFDPDTYDCKSPCVVLKTQIQLSEDETIPPVNLEVVIFPRDKMSTFAGFTSQEREKIKKYKISRNNAGFYIYRNGRLIRWGDKLNGLISKDDFGFRARIAINTCHDEILNVDVSKQHLLLPEDFLEALRFHIRIPRGQMSQAFELCERLVNSTEGEGVEFNQRNQDLPEDDPEALLNPPDKSLISKRIEKLSEKTQEEKEEEETKEGTAAAEPSPEEIFPRIRYSEKISAANLWEPGFDTNNGTYVRINKLHPFYSLVLANVSDKAPLKQAIEALILSCAIAENLTFKNLTDLDEIAIERVINKYKGLISNTVSTWSLSNQDLFE